MAARAGYDWRSHLTPEEAGAVKDLESQISEVDKRRRVLNADLAPIRNRAAKRASRDVAA